MKDELFAFRQKVWKAKYNWIEAEPVSSAHKGTPKQAAVGPYLVARVPVETKPEKLEPLVECPSLFLEFRRVELSKVDIAKFANRYGFLGHPVSSIVYPADTPREPENCIIGESLEAWEREIKIFKLSFDLWEAMLDGDIDKALIGSQYIMSSRLDGPEPAGLWLGSTQAYQDLGTDSGFALIATLDLPWEMKSGFALNWLVSTKLALLTRPTIGYNGHSKSFDLTFRPCALLGCLWLQFAHLISGSTEHKRCKQCKMWFAAKTKGRSTRRFCSEACRSMHKRVKQAEAIRLHGEGLPIHEIAEQLSSTVRTIGGWIDCSTKANRKKS